MPAPRVTASRVTLDFDLKGSDSELCGKVGDGVNQAADLISATASIPVLELYTADDFRQLVLTLQSPPGRGRRDHQFEHHETRGVLRQRAFHADGAMPHRREHALDRVRGSQVVPMIGGKVEERQQCLPHP